MATTLPATLLAASLLGLFLIYLSNQCVKLRIKEKVDIGTGNSPALERAVRAHANFIEYVPIALILIGLLEVNHAPTPLTYSLAVALVIGRILHAKGFVKAKGSNFGRFVGTLSTWLVIIIASLYGVYLSLF